jgi:hypothetical protein
MVCSARARSELYQVDEKWMVKFRLRLLLNTVSGVAIGAAAFTLGHTSQFQTADFKQTGAVVYYLPAVRNTLPMCEEDLANERGQIILTIIWNTINIAWLSKNRRPLPALANSIVHFILSAAFAVLGSLCTILVVSAYSNILDDPYGLEGIGSHLTTAANGTTITVTPENVGSCPAFLNCDAQQTWLSAAQRRSAFALGGCVLVDVALYVTQLIPRQRICQAI